MYIKSIHLSELRCFSDEDIRFQHPDLQNDGAAANVNCLLGNNGAGKTTILKAIALASLSPVIEGAGYVPFHLIRHGAAAAEVTADLILHEQDFHGAGDRDVVKRAKTRVEGAKNYERLVTDRTSSEIWEGMYDDDSPAFFIVGYGATRRVETSDYFDPKSLRKTRRLRYQRIAGLFEDHIALTPLAAWLPRLKERRLHRFEEIVALLKKALPADVRFNGEFKDGESLFTQGGETVPFSAMSDGCRAFIGWFGDLLFHLSETCPFEAALVDMRGVALVDEVDLHLHPKWQREVVSMISNALPRVQFVLSTHSPIVAGTLNNENLFVLESDSTRGASVGQIDERIYGKNAEQVLLSSYFNLKTTRAPGMENELREISRRAWKGDPDAAVQFLKKLSGTAEDAARRDA